MNPFEKEQNFRYFLAWELIPSETRRLLDIGCGEGKFLAGLKNKVASLYGIEVDLRKIKRAKLKYPF